MNRRLVIPLIALATLLAPAGSAHAATSCDHMQDIFTGADGRVTIDTTDTGQFTVEVGVGGTIVFNGAQCDGATTANTEQVVVNALAGTQEVVVFLGGGAFGPGQTTESTGISEIEFVINADSGTSDTLRISGSGGNDRLTAGSAGISLNTDADVDITFGGLPYRQWLEGGGGHDVLSGMGGFGSGGPITGAPGVDLAGENGNDLLLPSRNNRDFVRGDTGVDTVSFAGRPAGVKVTLAGPLLFNDGMAGDLDMVQGVENAFGTGFRDELWGTAPSTEIGAPGGDNALVGGAGNDYLNGLGGNDVLYGKSGDDTLIARDGMRDYVFGGRGADAARIDGKDLTRYVERYIP